MDSKQVAVIGIIILVYIVHLTIKAILNHKIKNKLIEKNADSEKIKEIIQDFSSNPKRNAIFWFLLLLPSSLYLIFVPNDFFMSGTKGPAGFILSFATSFLLYFMYLKWEEKDKV